MQTRLILYADEGKVLTDGDIYGTEIHLEIGRSAEEFHEISRAEYEAILEDTVEGGEIDET